MGRDVATETKTSNTKIPFTETVCLSPQLPSLGLLSVPTSLGTLLDTHLRETLLMLPNSSFRFSTSLICPFSGPFFTFSRPIR